MISTVDPETRHMHKSRSNYRDGYKAHLAVEPETGIITGCRADPGQHRRRPGRRRDCSPARNPAWRCSADSAYGSGPVRAELAAAGPHRR